MAFLFVGSSGLTEASFPRNLAIPQLLLSNVWAIVPLVLRDPMTVFTHRGLSPHQFTPMSGAHLALHRMRLRRIGELAVGPHDPQPSSNAFSSAYEDALGVTRMLATVRSRKVCIQLLRLGSGLPQTTDDVFVAPIAPVVLLLVCHGSFAFGHFLASRCPCRCVRRVRVAFSSGVFLRQHYDFLERCKVEWSSVLVT